ncbi:hypothetical protein NDU88_001218 [Pleurodeles waltl]|uniref:Uncharacterized protein n=1 Tax=Pleurodeles waltl TaxID=8319 RepID=A0AAV7P835_PLEWA|nr:hypothetical protein NDU88_001218 [Pleurodeles waltl]
MTIIRFCVSPCDKVACSRECTRLSPNPKVRATVTRRRGAPCITVIRAASLHFLRASLFNGALRLALPCRRSVCRARRHIIILLTVGNAWSLEAASAKDRAGAAAGSARLTFMEAPGGRVRRESQPQGVREVRGVGLRAQTQPQELRPVRGMDFGAQHRKVVDLGTHLESLNLDRLGERA